MRNLRRICLLLLVIVMGASLVVPGWAADTPSASAASASGCVTLDAQLPLKSDEKLLDTAKSVILYELQCKVMVYAWNPDEQIDPSGMNKIMTALLALELAEPDAMVTVSRDALNSVAIGSVSAGLKREEEISLRDLLFCMMVGSANDAAAVIAEYVGSSQTQFVEMMNKRAKELGCENTNFLNANGLSAEGQYTTARDLAKITEAALENELFVELFSTVNYTVPATNKSAERYIVTTNYLMSKEQVKTQFDSRVTGGKTGALSTTDRSLICTAEHGGKQYLAVVMSAQGTVTENGLSVKTFGSFEETKKLLNHGFGTYSVRQILQEGQVLQQFEVTDGENSAAAGPAKTVYVPLPEDAAPEDVSYRCVLSQANIQAPLTKGQVIGTVEVWYRNVCIGLTDLVTIHSVYKAGEHMTSLTPSAEPQMDEQLKNWLLIGGLVLLAAVLVTVAVILVKLWIRKRQLDRRHKLINEGRTGHDGLG